MARFVLCVVLLVSAAAAWAGKNKIVNGGFESGTEPNICNVYNLGVGSNVLTGWQVIVGNIDWEGPPPCGWAASQGQNSIDLVGDACIGGIQQTFATSPGEHYILSFDLAGNYGNPPAIKPLAVTINGVTHNFLFDTTGKSQFNMGWVKESIIFHASGSTSTISFVSDVSASGGACNAGAAIDNVRVHHAF